MRAATREPTLRLPDFLYVGTSRAGSSWLHQILLEHPQIAMPAAREIRFFDQNYRRGAEWYGRFFAGAGDRITGEVWHDYFCDPQVAGRIHTLCPDVRVIAALREPVDRAISRLGWSRANEAVGNVALSDFALRADIAREADYFNNLRPYFERFPRERILVLFYDELAADPGVVAGTLFRFLGVDARFRPPSVDERVGWTRASRLALLTSAARLSVRLLRRIGAPVPWSTKRSKVMNALLYRAADARAGIVPTADDVSRIEARYHPHYDDLETLIGRPLPASWRRNRPTRS